MKKFKKVTDTLIQFQVMYIPRG